MSDLAPFVAAILKDKVVQDLIEENESLRKKNNAMKLVMNGIEITGPRGQPVYATGSLDADEYINSVEHRRVGLEQLELLPVNLIATVELWIGGSQRGRLSTCSHAHVSKRGDKVYSTFVFGWGTYVRMITEQGQGSAKEPRDLQQAVREIDDIMGTAGVTALLDFISEDNPKKKHSFYEILLPTRENEKLLAACGARE